MNPLKKIAKHMLTDFDRNTLYLSNVAFLATVVFSVYNGFLGLKHSSLWHGSICIYYIILSLLRGTLLAENGRIKKSGNGDCGEKIRKVYLFTHAVLLLLNLSLVVPISMMAKFEMPVDMTLIPAIAMAAYTMFRIVFASVNYRWKEKSDNLIVKELRTIALIDAILAVMTLQNTLIVVSSDEAGQSMKTLPLFTNAVMLVLIIAISIRSFVREAKR